MARGIDAQVARPLDVAADLASAEAKRGMILSMLLPVLLTLTSFIGGAYLVMDATAGERERQSLEPLLATPGSRSAIVSGKIAAACVVGFVSLLLTLVAFKVSAQIAPGNIGRQFNMNVDAADAAGDAADAADRHLAADLPVGSGQEHEGSAEPHDLADASADAAGLCAGGLPAEERAVAVRRAVPVAEPDAAEGDPPRDHHPAVWAIYLGASLGLAAVLWFAAVRRYHNERLAISG
jgi:sodium transport system permease protein